MAAWYVKLSIRRCEDGSLHEGRLELITGRHRRIPATNTPEALGWGACVEEAAGDLKQKFEVYTVESYIRIGHRLFG